ncbi:hypothetical protein VTO42DRAFT_7951 [Malbranchea cinnamomea]
MVACSALMSRTLAPNATTVAAGYLLYYFCRRWPPAANGGPPPARHSRKHNRPLVRPQRLRRDPVARDEFIQKVLFARRRRAGHGSPRSTTGSCVSVCVTPLSVRVRMAIINPASNRGLIFIIEHRTLETQSSQSLTVGQGEMTTLWRDIPGVCLLLASADSIRARTWRYLGNSRNAQRSWLPPPYHRVTNLGPEEMDPEENAFLHDAMPSLRKKDPAAIAGRSFYFNARFAYN